MLAESPRISNRVRDLRTRDSGNTILSKEFRGGSLVTVANESSLTEAM